MDRYVRINPWGSAVVFLAMLTMLVYSSYSLAPKIVSAVKKIREIEEVRKSSPVAATVVLGENGDGGGATAAVRIALAQNAGRPLLTCGFFQSVAPGDGPGLLPQLWSIVADPPQPVPLNASGLKPGTKLTTGPGQEAGVDIGGLFKFILLPESEIIFGEMTDGKNDGGARIALAGFKGAMLGRVKDGVRFKSFEIQSETLVLHPSADSPPLFKFVLRGEEGASVATAEGSLEVKFKDSPVTLGLLPAGSKLTCRQDRQIHLDSIEESTAAELKLRSERSLHFLEGERANGSAPL